VWNAEIGSLFKSGDLAKRNSNDIYFFLLTASLPIRSERVASRSWSDSRCRHVASAPTGDSGFELPFGGGAHHENHSRVCQDCSRGVIGLSSDVNDWTVKRRSW